MTATETEEKYPIGTLVLCDYGCEAIRFRVISSPNFLGSYAAVADKGEWYQGMAVILTKQRIESGCLIPATLHRENKPWWKFW